MAHYAFIDENSIVTEVIVGRDETDLVDGIESWETYYAQYRPGQKCVRTSYNGNIRKNFAGIGYTYDEARDAFIPPKPFNSWLLNEDTCQWEAPLPRPEFTEDTFYDWDEETQTWQKFKTTNSQPS